jgi:ADP-heptose:LPS heptosyltransferase
MYRTSKIFWPFLLILDVLGYVFFFWKKYTLMPKQIKKVLFMRLEHIGDMIMATPVFENWKKNYPDCEIHVMCRSLTKPLIEHNPYVSKIITFEAPWFIRAQKQDKTLSEVAVILKKEKYDIVFEMHGNPRSIRLSHQTDAYTVGYGCRGFGFLLNKCILYKDQQMIKQNLELIKPFCTITTEKTKIYIDKKSELNAKKIMQKYRLKPRSFIIVNPLSGRAEKDLTDDEVITYIRENKKYTILITGAASEAAHNKRFRSLPTVIDLTGKTDLLTMVELVKNAKRVYAPDTAIVHMAHAVGTSCHAVYRTTDKRIWGYERVR